MLSTNKKISLRQFQILVVLCAMGTGVIVLPRRVAEVAGVDGWIIVVGLTVIAMGVGWLVSAAMGEAGKFGGGFLAGVGGFVGRPLAFVLGVLLWIKIVFSAGLELRVFLGITREVLLPHTPLLVVGAVMVLLCGYGAAKGIETKARVGEILLGVMVLPVVFLVGLAFFSADFSNLQPVFTAEPRSLVSGIFGLGFIFTGMEMLLLVRPFLAREKNMGRAVLAALGVAGAFITLVTIITIAEFGPAVVNQPWPVLRLMDMLSLPGAFVQRQEALMFSFWIITTFMLVSCMLWGGGTLAKEALRIRGLSMGALLTGAAVFGVAAIPWDGDEIYKRLDFMYITFGLFFLVILPVFLLAAAKARQLTKMQKAAKGLGLILLLATGLAFTGCWDKIEIEDRAFVIAMGVDKYKGGYKLSLAMPVTEEPQDENHIKTATARTITEAIKKLDSKDNKDLYYGQAKLVVLGNEVLKDEQLLRGIINALDNHSEIDRRINIVAAAGSAQDVLEIKPPGETLPGLHTPELYSRKNKLGGISFALDLQQLSSALTFSNGAILPILKANDKTDELKLEGAAIVKNYKKAGKLTQQELTGLLWTFPNGNKSAVVTINSGGNTIPMTIEKQNTKTRFQQTSSGLATIIEIKITGRIKESAQYVTDNTHQEFAQQIAAELTATAHKLQAEAALDGFNWLETLRKKHPDLYLQYAPSWPQTFAEIEIIPHVTVNIKL
ncbi:MAG: Ger(x)C family spore germination protein [Defluviitaleaceae bacterium]|nr:Ger(x)C family spore germination protein [Defluviitaleaceae bacterium]